MQRNNEIREQIRRVFEGKAFDRPLFYSYEGGLRFKLSEGEHFINQFLTAHSKGLEICRYIFSDHDSIKVCLKILGCEKQASISSVVKQLKIAGVYPDVPREYWTEVDPELESDGESERKYWHYIVFGLPKSSLENFLWCAFASDFRSIQPNSSRCDYYLFDIDREILVFPYDDRGMDVVGNNKELLSELYQTFNHYLLDYDRQIMDVSFR